MSRLEGKTAVVTGGARGTGEAISRRFVEEGARVAIFDILDDRGKAVAGDLGKDGTYLHCDVTREEDWQAALESVEQEFGTVEVLVNNAAVLHLRLVVDTDLDDYLRVVMVNEIGPFLGIKTVAPGMMRSGRGSIINIGSVDGFFVSPLTAAYAASKFHLRGLAKSAAVELGESGIRVNTICPAVGNPEMVFSAMPPEIQAAFAGVGLDTYADQYPAPPIGRHGRFGDVASMCVFLASDESEFITGADLMVDGGATAGYSQRMVGMFTNIQVPG